MTDWNQSPFLRAANHQPTDVTPVWIMRQAGRYLPEYMAVREKVSFLELCKTPDLAVEVTLQPIDRLGVDAAIIFSDILIPAEAMGLEVDFPEKGGPKFARPVRTSADVDALSIPDPVLETPFVMDSIRLARKHLEGRVPLIGFAGAPFTMAAYMVEGMGSKNYIILKEFMFQQPALFHRLMDKIADTVTAYLNAQIEAGAQTVQLFDTWAGILSPRDYQEFALPYVEKIFAGLNRKGTPAIYFVQDGTHLLEIIPAVGADVYGLDWRVNLDEGWERLGFGTGVQGNLDPCALMLPPEQIRERVQDILVQAGNRPGHIFNLGHGILPNIKPEHAKVLVDAVHEISREMKK